MVEVPVGPIHAGIIEPGHFRFAAIGELVLQLEARLFYTHRGIEKLAEGRTPDQALPLVERLCGACAFSHAVAFCEAVESLAGPRCRRGRTGAARCCSSWSVCTTIWATPATSAPAPASPWAPCRARCSRNGSSSSTSAWSATDSCAARVPWAACDATWSPASYPLHSASSSGCTPRRGPLPTCWSSTMGSWTACAGPGRLESETVRALGGVGPAARAAGVDVDVRRDRPYAAYAELRHALHIPIHQAGDVEARLRQRLAEATVSFRLLEELLASPPGGPVRAPLGPVEPHRLGLGAVESPRGADVHAVLCDADGRIERYRVRSASFPNWPLVPLAVPGDLMPDFPLINKSFELCYACLDR